MTITYPRPVSGVAVCFDSAHKHETSFAAAECGTAQANALAAVPSTMTSATYLPAGCKRVKLNLGNAYRTTARHLVAGDQIRVQKTGGDRAPFAVSPTYAPKSSLWANVVAVKWGNGWYHVTVTVLGEEVTLYLTTTRGVTRKERPEEYSARLMLAEQERAAAVKASEEAMAAAKERVEQAEAARVAAADAAKAEEARLLECGTGGHAHTTALESASCDTQARLANVKAGGTWSDPIVPAAFSAARAERSGRKASGRYTPGKAPSAPVGLVIPVSEQTADMPVRRGVQVSHPDYVGTVWVVRFTHGGGLGSDLVADLIHFGTGDQLRDVKVTDLTPVTTDQVAGTAAIPVQRQPEEEVLARNGARVHRRASWPTKLTRCGLDVSGPANGYDGPKCLECFPAPAELDDARMIQQVAYARGGQPAQDLADMRVRATTAEAKLAEVQASLQAMLQEAKEARHHANRLGAFDREAYAQADTRVAVLEEALGYLI